MSKLRYIILIGLAITVNLAGYSQVNIVERTNLKYFPFDLEDCTSNSMSYLDTLVSQYNHFISAEYHRVPSAIHLQKKMISYLVRHRELSKIVVERSYSFGFWMNQYLHSGDTSLLREITNNYSDWDVAHDSTNLSPDFFHLYEWIYTLSDVENTTLEIVGTDVEHTNFRTEIWSLEKFFTKYNLTNDLTNSYSLLRSYDKKVSASKMRKWLKVFDDERNIYTQLLREKMGDNYVHFEQSVSNIYDALPEFKMNRKAGYRDSIMYKNYMKYVAPDDVAYAQFGHGHTTLKYGERTPRLQGKSFASHVEDNPMYQGRSLSFNLICNKCYYRYAYLITEEQHDEIGQSTNYKPIMIDFRSAKEEFADFSNYFPFVIFIYD